MMTWLNSPQLKNMIGKSLDTAQRIIKTHAQAYPLCVRKVIPTGRSRPSYEVLWDTDTNQPATSAETTTGNAYAEPATDKEAATRGQGIDKPIDTTSGLPRFLDRNGQDNSEGCADTAAYFPRKNSINTLITGEDHANHRTDLQHMAGFFQATTDALGNDISDGKNDCAPVGICVVTDSALSESLETTGRVSPLLTTGDNDGHTNSSTHATLDTRDFSGVTNDSATGASAACAGVQQPSAESGRYTELDDATATPLVVSSTLSHSGSAIIKESGLFGQRQASNGGAVSQGAVTEINPVLESKLMSLDSSTQFKVITQNAERNARDRSDRRIDALCAVHLSDSVLESDNLPVVAANIDFHPESFDCQIHYVLRLIEKQQLGKVCRSNALTSYFKTVLVADARRADWDALLNNTQRIKFAELHKLVGEIPNRLKAEGNPKSLSGRPSTVSDEAVAWIIKTVQEWADDDAPVRTATRCRTDYMLQQLLKKDLGISLSEKQIATVVRKNNLRQLMNKPQGKEGKKVGKQKGTYPRLPVNSLWLMDGVVPELLYIRDLNGRYTKISCIGIEDVGSRKLLGFKEYYSESGVSSVNLFKAVMTENKFKKGTSGELIAPTLRPDKGSGFMTSMGACAFAIGKAYAESHHFTIDFKEANAGSPTEKAHLESSWKSVHSSYRMLVQNHFAKLGKIDKTPIVNNHKRGIEMSALYIDITLEELRASGIAEEFKDLMNNRLRQFTEDNRTLRFVPNKRWARYLSGTTVIDHKWARFAEELDEKSPIAPPPENTVFSADDTALEMLNVFGYAKHDSNVRPDMTIQYKVGYNVPRDLGFSVTRSTPIRVSEMPDGSGRLAIFTAKEKKSKTKHDFGAEFLGFATVKAIGGNEEKAAHVRRKKAERVSDVVELSKKQMDYSLILKEIQPFLVSFGSESDTKGLGVLAGMKLTPGLAYAVIFELCVDKTTGEQSKVEFKRFHMEARKRLQNILVLPTTQRNMR